MRDRLSPHAAATADRLLSSPPAARGSLTVVGTGIQLATHLTPEARAAIERADVLLYLAAEPAGLRWLDGLHPNARSLNRHYADGVDRLETYAAIVDEILGELRAGADVCAAFYGHPGVFVTPSHEAVRRAREEGFDARMLPGISAIDCLFADVGIDPAASGCLVYEAADFLVRHRAPDPAASLILLQAGALGRTDASTGPEPGAVALLVDVLAAVYPAGHEVVLYEASPYPVAGPRIESAAIGDLPRRRLTALTTLYVPPATIAPADSVRASLLLTDPD